MPGGSDCRMRSTSACTSLATATVLLSGWRLMLSKTAGLPFAVTMVYTGLTPGATAATSATLHRHAGCRVLHYDLPKSVRDRAPGHPPVRDRAGDSVRSRPGESMRLVRRHRIENVGDGHAGRQQLGGIGRDVELGLLASLHQHRRDAIEAVQARLQFIGRQRPQLRLRNRV